VKKKVIIIDYGLGNILSIKNAVEYLGHKSILTSDPKIIEKSKILILPGVGSFNDAMKKLNKLKITDSIKKNIEINKGKILGICLGMQLLATKGTENGNIEGLGLIEGDVISLAKISKKILPHIGFNLVETNYNEGIFNNIDKNRYFYFVHSYFFLPNKKNLNFHYSYCNYGGKFISSFESKQIFGTQFHPEKSQTNGLKLLKNFLY
jgi:glutamine amidotransferase